MSHFEWHFVFCTVGLYLATFWRFPSIGLRSDSRHNSISRRRNEGIKANSHIPCRAHAVPLPCRAAKGLDCVFPFDLNSAAVFESHMPCRAHAAPMPRPCHATTIPFWKRHLQATAQRGMVAAGEWQGMCELASAVQRRHVGDVPTFGFFRLRRGVPRSLLSEAYQSVKL
jgi:hypothetical protein